MRILTAPLIAEHSELSAKKQPGFAELFDDTFKRFLEHRGQSVSWLTAEDTAKSPLHSIPHGNMGSRVVWSMNNPLSNSWRVAAYHSNHIAKLDSFDPEHLEKADGIFVHGAGFRAPLAIKTADCLAVAVTLESSSSVDAAICFHAGWRGYCGGIQTAAIKMLQADSFRRPQHSAETSAIYVTVGPAVFGGSYPCGADVLGALVTHHSERLVHLPHWSEHHESAFWDAAGRHKLEVSGKIYPDLQQLICIELDALGLDLSRVTLYRENTFTSQFWPSHRRSVSRGEESKERLVTHLCPPGLPISHKPW
jgi:polyphenol oxidase